MKQLLLIIGLLTSLFFTSYSQNPDEVKILKQSFRKCQSIQNGYYEMERHMKYISKNDTSFNKYNCYFKKLADDTIYSSAFHYQHYRDGQYGKDVLYTGDDFVSYSVTDSTGEIMSKKLWANDIKSYSHNYKFFSPITDRESIPFPNDTAYNSDKFIFQLLEEERIGNFICYHVKLNIIPENDSTEMMKNIRTEVNYWINKQDDMPIQYTIAYDYIMNNDTMYQFEKSILTKYELNDLKEEHQLELSSIPLYIDLKDYIPYKSPKLLPNNTIAPNWSLVSLDDKIVNLSDFNEELVLIDFFYKSCYPCMLALPALQALHEKYNSKGLKLIGIDPFDTKEKDEIDTFLTKRGITYTVLLGGKEVANAYNVSGYPTIYLINKKREIIFKQVGYGENTEKELEKVILKNL